ncbi:hypothetical protein [Amycolatopsis sp. cg9]|uniref:hypothetical protein n=1 Tax=Amycolatopsis sp. cg9 TaxID=3238801 RepID=UPI0035248EB2
MFPFDQLGRAAQAVVREAEEAGSALVHSAHDAASWAGDLFAGDVGVQAMSVPAVVDQVMAGDASSWSECGSTSAGSGAAHHEIAAALTGMLSNLESVWTGGGAVAAAGQAKSFSDLVTRAAMTLSSNGCNVTDAAYGFELAKRSMEPMGDPPDKSFFDVATPWDTDTEDAVAAFNAKAQKNLRIYDSYVQHLGVQGEGLSGDYGQLIARNATEDVTPADQRRVTSRRSALDTARPTRPVADHSTADTVVGDTDRGRTGTGSVDPQTRAHDDGSDVGAGPRDPRAVAGSASESAESAGLAGSMFDPARAAAISGAGAAWPFTAGAAAGAPAASEAQWLAGVPLAGPGAPNLGGPKGTAGVPGNGLRGQVEPTAGGVGARGAAGSAGVAPGASRRESASDTEHERKYIRDENSVFDDEENDGLVDPRTGLAPVPPTLGTS